MSTVSRVESVIRLPRALARGKMEDSYIISRIITKPHETLSGRRVHTRGHSSLFEI